MSSLEVTESQVIAQVRSILVKDPDARTIGIRSEGPWRSKSELLLGEHRLLVTHCTSHLAIREALVAQTEENEIKVLLTSLDGNQLGQDVLARLWKQQFFAIQSWRIVRDLFSVDEIDARLVHHKWMADALLSAQPSEGFPKVPGQVLTSDFAWQMLLKLYLGFEQPQVDAIELARWAKSAERVETYLQAPLEFRSSLPDWISHSAGEVGRIILGVLEHGHGKDLIPLGLVCQVVFNKSIVGAPELATAGARLEERFLGGKTLHPDVGMGWGAAVSSVVEADLAKREFHTIQVSVVTFFDGFLVKLFDGCDLANYTLPLFPSE